MNPDFNAVFLDKGGELHIESDPNKLPYLMAMVSAMDQVQRLFMSNPGLPVPTMGVVNNNSFNSRAAKDKYNNYYIGLYKGLILVMFDLFQRMLSSNEILPGFGDCSKENPTSKIFSTEQHSWAHLEAIKDPAESLEPKDEERKNLVWVLLDIAIRNLVIHEYAHIVNGHLDYISSTKHLNHIGELHAEEEGENKLDPLFSQTLEMDADAYAANLGMQYVFQAHAHIQLVGEDYRPFFKDFNTLLFIYFVSTYTYFRVRGYVDHTEEEMHTRSHPLPAIRQQTVFAMAGTSLMRKRHPMSVDQMSVIGANAIMEVESAFKKMSEKEMNTKAIAFVLKGPGLQHMNLLKANWKNVRHLLESFALVPLAPFEDDDEVER